MSDIRKKEMDFLSGEINYWLEKKLVTSEQAENILSLYTVKNRNLRTILFIAGGILLGLGFVSFVAAHWHELPKIFRVCLISAAYLASLTAYYFCGKSESRAGKAFLLLASVIFGSGIFLITRMYNYKLYWQNVTGWWIIQVIITAFISRDFWQVYLAQILSLLYLNGINAIDIFALEFANMARISVFEFFAPWNAFALIITLWILWRTVIKDRVVFNVNMLLTLLLFASRMSLCFGGTWTLIILAASGAIMSFISRSHDAEIFGLLMLGLFGLLLTWAEFWRGEIFATSIFSISGKTFFPVCTALITAVVMLVNIYRGHVAIGIIFCAFLASRYFFDHLFGYMPKAWGFTLTGIIFLIAGIFFGKIRKLFESKNKNFSEVDTEE